MKKSLLSLFLLMLLMSCSSEKDRRERPIVFVSILPQKYFVEKIAKDSVQTEVMIRAGQSPTLFDPTSRQLMLLSKASLYFRIGVPFERVWIGKIKEINPQLRIVDTRKGIELRRLDRFQDIFSDQREGNLSKEALPDPHIWLSPALVKKQILTIEAALSEFNPKLSELYRSNRICFDRELDEVQKEFREKLSHRIDKILVFHPSWGYLLDEFGIRQIPIEIEGKSPSPSELRALIDYAKKEGIHTVFVQKQFSKREAQSIARGIGGKVVELDPLAYDYLAEMREVIKKLNEAF